MTNPEAEWEPEPADELKAELERRSAEVDTNPDCLVSWDSIVEYIRRKR